MKQKLLLLISLFLTEGAFAASVKEVRGSIIGDLAQLKVQVTVGGVFVPPSEQAQTKSAPSVADLISNLSIYLIDDKVNPALPLLMNTTKSSSTSNSYFQVQNITAIVSVDDPILITKKIEYTFIIAPNNSVTPVRKLSEVATAVDGAIAVRVMAQFNPYTNGSYDNTSTTAQGTRLTGNILQIFSSPNGKPENFAVKPDFKRLKIAWTTDKVAYVPAPPLINQEPDEVLVMVFNGSPGPIALNAYNASSSSDVADKKNQITCTVDFGAACHLDCPDKGTSGAWIDVNQSHPDIELFKLVPNTGSFLVPSLIPDQPYTIMLQYRQGVQVTECLIGIPKVTYSVSDLNGGEPSHEGDPRCFIVSAAFDSPFNRHVDIFRWFRDEFLESTRLGHDFVEFYYKHSQPFADLIKSSSSLQFVARLFLYPLAFVLYGIQESMEYPLLISTLLVSLMLLFFWMRRRKLTRC